MGHVKELFTDLTTKGPSADGFYIISVKLRRKFLYAGTQTTQNKIDLIRSSVSGSYREDNEIMARELEKKRESVSGNMAPSEHYIKTRLLMTVFKTSEQTLPRPYLVLLQPHHLRRGQFAARPITVENQSREEMQEKRNKGAGSQGNEWTENRKPPAEKLKQYKR